MSIYDRTFPYVPAITRQLDSHPRRHCKAEACGFFLSDQEGVKYVAVLRNSYVSFELVVSHAVNCQPVDINRIWGPIY